VSWDGTPGPAGRFPGPAVGRRAAPIAAIVAALASGSRPCLQSARWGPQPAGRNEECFMSHHEGKAKGGAMKDGAGAKKATAKTTKKK